jgi:hypothetical protein
MLALLPVLVSVIAQPKSVLTSQGPRIMVAACTAVTQADVEREIGRQVAKGVESESGATCDYEGTAGIVTVMVHRLTGSFDFDAELASLRAAMPAARVRPFAGIGSRAVLVDLPNAGAQLHVIRQGSVYVMISVLGFGPASDVSRAAEALARRALDVI